MALLSIGLAGGALAQAPPAYSLPWLLRPAAAGTVVRLDSTYAMFENAAGASRGTFVESVSASYKASARLTPVFRVSFIHDDGADATAISNPLVGVNYVRPLSGPWRLSLFAAATAPIGSGGGDSPRPGKAAAAAAAIPARSAMDNALFAVNYWTVIGGVGAARVTPALTFQAEASLLQLTRVRGPSTQDGSRTNLTVGLHAGRFFGSRFSLSAELRLQRWLSDAAPARANPKARETATFDVGPRFHWKLGKRVVRPGVSWSRALDDPMRSQGYDILQLDLPIAF